MTESALADPAVTLIVIHEVLAEFLSLAPQEIDDDVDLEAHGADSIDRVEILVTLKSRLGVDLPLAAFASVPNLSALAVLLATESEIRS